MWAAVAGDTMTREDMAWAAGFFEGEGCITMYYRTGRSGGKEHLVAELAVYSTDPDVLRRFHNIVKVGHIRPHLTNRLPKGKPAESWKTAKFEHVQAVIAFLWPWLCTRRRARAEEVLLAMRSYHQSRTRKPRTILTNVTRSVK